MNDGFDPDFVNQFELETWSRCAPDYLDGFASMTSETLPMLIGAAGIRSGQSVLDVGSGPGHIAGAISGMGCSASGIDFSDEMVEISKRNYPEANFQQGNAEELPFEDDSFDSAISNFVVHHLARPEKVFSEISRVLKEGGKFAYAVFADPAAQSSIGAFFAAVEQHHDLAELPHGPLFGVTDLDVHEAMLSSGGFERAEFEFKPLTWRSSDAETVYNSFANWGNLGALPVEVSERIRKTTLESYEGFRTEDGYEFPHMALIASAST